MRRLRAILFTCACAALALPATASAAWVAGDMAGADPDPFVNDVAVDPVDGALWASTSSGVWRSADDGLTWAESSTGPPATAAVAAGGGLVWAYATDGSVRRSPDGGDTWSTISTSWSLPGQIAADPATGDAFVTTASSSPAPRVARIDGGAAVDWSTGLPDPVGSYTLAGVDPSTHRVFVTAVGGGMAMRAPGDPSWSVVPGSSSIVRAAVDAATAPATLVGVTDDGHVLRSTTTGAAWTTTQPPLAGSFFTARVAAGGGRIAVLFGGADALGVAVSDDGGTTWATWAHPSTWAADALAVAADDTVAVSGDDGVRMASAASPPVSAPVALKLPVAFVAVDAEVGSTIDLDAGSWLGASGASLTRQWLRCLPADPGDCSPIAGSTGQSYVSTWSDLDHHVRADVTGGATTIRSNAVTVELAKPQLLAPGALAGALVVGATVTVTPATWGGADAVDRTISSCASGPADCRSVSGDAYLLTEADQGRVLVITEVAQNARGSTTTQATPVGPVLGPPRSIAAPALTGTADVGGTLAFAAGFEDGVTLAYAWSRCAAACTPIDGATGPAYVVTEADRGLALQVVATATNAQGSRTSAATSGVVPTLPPAPPSPPTMPPTTPPTTQKPKPTKPALRARPAVTGQPRPTRLLACTTGRWANAPARYAYRWLRNGALLKGTARTYRVTAADRGKRLACRVTATNRAGSTTATSAAVRVPLPARR